MLEEPVYIVSSRRKADRDHKTMKVSSVEHDYDNQSSVRNPRPVPRSRISAVESDQFAIGGRGRDVVNGTLDNHFNNVSQNHRFIFPTKKRTQCHVTQRIMLSLLLADPHGGFICKASHHHLQATVIQPGNKDTSSTPNFPGQNACKRSKRY